MSYDLRKGSFEARLLLGVLLTTYLLRVKGEPGSGVSVYSAKSKARCNPLYRTSLGTGPINEFAFSPCGHYLAAVSQVKPGKNIYKNI